MPGARLALTLADVPSSTGFVATVRIKPAQRGCWLPVGGGGSGEDHGGAELAPDLGSDVRAEEAREEPVVVLAEDDDVGPGVARRVDDRPPRLARSPHEIGVQTRGLDRVARLREQADQLGRWRDRLALPVGDVVEGAEEPVDLRIQRDFEDREHDETGLPRLRLGDAAVERSASRRRIVKTDEDTAHGPQSTHRHDAASWAVCVARVAG